MKKFINKPQNWQDFEDLIKNLYGEIWECTDSIEKNGRQGNDQSGVDIFAFPKKAGKYRGIQCKGKDDYTNKKLTKVEIDCEIAKALNFDQPLETFIFATTSVKDLEIQKYIRQKDVEYRASHGMQIHVVFWDGIDELIQKYPRILSWYEGKDHKEYDIEVFFANGQQESIITPMYSRKTLRWTQDVNLYHDHNSKNRQHNRVISNLPQYDQTFRDTTIVIKNIGTSNLKDYRIEFTVQRPFKKISDINNSFGMFPRPTSHDGNQIIYTGRDTLLQGQSVKFQIYFQPQEHKEYDVPIHWQLKTDGLRKEGTLILQVRPDFKDTLEYGLQQITDEYIQDQIHIEPLF